MSVRQKSTALYASPFSKAYWRDAAMELKDTKMLVFAATMVAVRVAMKGLSITIGPNLYINTAFLANALGAMVFGPVVAAVAAVVSDFLGFLIFPQGGAVYFPPYILVEVAGSVIFALLLYRARLTPTRIILSRFCICLFVNILLQAPITLWYYKVVVGKAYVMFQIPHIIKNLAMFPIESWLLTFVLSLLAPVCYRMGLIYDAGPGKGSLKFTGRQIALLVILFAVGAGCVLGYLGYYYNTTSRSASYSAEERPVKNHQMQTYVLQESDDYDNVPTVTIVESAMQPFLGKEATYTVAVYEVLEGEGTDAQWAYSKSKAAKDEGLNRLGTATIVVNEKTGQVLSYTMKPEAPKE